MMRSTLLALLRFHLRSTVRITIRNTTIQASVVFALVGLTPDPSYLVLSAAGVAARGESSALWVLALWLWGNAIAAQSPLETTLRGWHRHLPLGRDHRRRGAFLAVLASHGPVIALALGLWFLGWVYGGSELTQGPVSWTFPAAVILLSPATAMSVIRWRPRWAGLIGLPMLIALTSGGWWGIPTALMLLLLHDRLDVAPASSSRLMLKPAQPRRKLIMTGRLLPWRLAWRTTGPGTLLRLWATAAVPLASAWLFIRNNELQLWEEAIGTRVGGGIALIAILLPLTGELGVRRPVWPWARSLPWSSRTRLLHDAGFLATATVPVCIGCAFLAGWALPPLLACVALQSIRLATALRRRQEGVTRLGAAAIAEVWWIQIVVAAWPWLAWGCVLAIPAAIRYGVAKEQALKASRWRERHHFELGDSAL